MYEYNCSDCEFTNTDKIVARNHVYDEAHEVWEEYVD